MFLALISRSAVTQTQRAKRSWCFGAAAEELAVRPKDQL